MLTKRDLNLLKKCFEKEFTEVFMTECDFKGFSNQLFVKLYKLIEEMKASRTETKKILSKFKT